MPQTAERAEFWTEYQPGFRATDAAIGSPRFYSEVAEHRYALEPAIEEQVRFEDWRGADVLEAGCGIGTDAERFLQGGARYTGIDLSPTALALAAQRFAQARAKPQDLIRASVTRLPFDDASFDLVYANGVIHHVADTAGAVGEFRRVLRPGGTAIVMLYHRSSINYLFTIMALRRALAAVLLLPGADRVVAQLTGEDREVLTGHRRLLREHGLRYLTDRSLFLSHNTDGPGNPLSKVYNREEAERLFSSFELVETRVRFLNLRIYPLGSSLSRSSVGRRMERRVGWHLWVQARR